MKRLLWLSSIRYLMRHKLKVLLSILGIALGVAVVAAVDISTSSAKKSFTLSTEQILGNTTHQIIGASQGVNERLYSQLRRQLLPRFPGIKTAPVIKSYASSPLSAGKILQILGIDPFAETAFRNYSKDNENMETDFDLRQFLSEKNTALLSRITAKDLAINIDDMLPIQVGDRIVNLTIIGLFGSPDDSRMANLLIMDIATAQEIFSMKGKLSHIDLVLPRDSPIAKLFMEQIDNWLPNENRIINASTSFKNIGSLTDAFHLNLTALSFLALVVGLFLIYNTMNFSVVQRLPLLGRLRAMGVTNKEIFLLIIGEALLLGLTGTAIGLYGGYLLAKSLLILVNQTTHDLYYTVTVTDLTVSSASLIKASILGFIATFSAALIPARQAASAPPHLVMQRIDQERHIKKRLRLFLLLSALFVLLCLFFSLYRRSGLPGGFMAIVCIVLSSALITPHIMSLFAKFASVILQPLLGVVSVMGSRDNIKNLSRTGLAAMALMIAIATTNSVGIMIKSFRESVESSLKKRLNADIYITPFVRSSANRHLYISEDVYEMLQNHNSVKELSRFYDFRTEGNGHILDLISAEIPTRARQGYTFLSVHSEQAWKDFDSGSILITESLSNKIDLSVGDALTFFTDVGSQHFKIAGIYYDYGSEHGRVLMKREQFLKYWQAPYTEGVGIYLDKNIKNKKQFISQLETSIGQLQPLLIRDNQNILERALQIFDRTFTVTKVLRLVAIVVAFIGIISTLMALQLERQREIATLRAIGLTRWEVAKMLLIQSSLLGLTAGLLALPVGQLMAWILIDVVNVRAFGWTMTFNPAWALNFQSIGFSVLAALLASLYPAWLFAATSPADGLRDNA